MERPVLNKTFTRKQSIEVRDELIWNKLSGTTISDALAAFLCSLASHHTQKAYQTAFNLFFRRGLLDPMTDLRKLGLFCLENLLDLIREKNPGSEATKQARAAAFISFTGFLQRKTGGIIQKATPSKETKTKTFKRIREKAHTKAMDRIQWNRFLRELKRLSFRDYLIAKTILQGAKRISEVTKAEIPQIDWGKRQIRFKQLKSHFIHQETVITYPDSFMSELKEYLGSRELGYIFITRNELPISRTQLYLQFRLVGKRAQIPFSVSPHCLRASAVTYLRSLGYSSDDIMKISGHSDAKLVHYYDKSDLEDNPTKEISLI